MKKLFELPLLAVFPKRCAYCGKPVASDRPSCKSCEAQLPRIKGDICPLCGREEEYCSCRGATYYNGMAAPFYYEGCVRRGMHIFKFRRNPKSAQTFGEEAAKAVIKRFADKKFDMIISVPLTDKRLKERGYDQCALIAKEISDRTEIPFIPDVIKKIYETDKQHGLSYYLRKGNLTGVFDIESRETVANKTVLLCDDISTSGETMDECAKMLWLCGAKEVYCIAVAITKMKKKKK